jgi:aminoglycoside phosphotransferase (APT) family kinase protein
MGGGEDARARHEGARGVARRMRPIASGRASELFDLGDGRVLRRFKARGDPHREALVMRHAGRHGYPVPRVLDVTSDALVLERIEGPTMARELAEHASRSAAHAFVLARLHDELHAIAAPPTLPAVGEGDRLLHLDLHPANVIVAATGPVVVDWTNARAGDPALDVAYTWVIGATSGGEGRVSRAFLARFLAHFDLRELLRWLPRAAECRMLDANVTAAERAAIRGLLQRARQRLGADLPRSTAAR